MIKTAFVACLVTCMPPVLCAREIPLADVLDVEAIDPAEVHSTRLAVQPTVDPSTLPPGLMELEQAAWTERAELEAELRGAISGAVKRRRMLLNKVEKGKAKARARLEQEGPLYFPSALCDGGEAWQDLEPRTEGWSRLLDGTLLRLCAQDPRRYCEDDLVLAPAASFLLRLRLTLLEALVADDLDGVRELEARYRRWVFRADHDPRGLVELPTLRASRLHAPPSYLPAEISERTVFEPPPTRGPNRDLLSWRRAARVDFAEARRDVEAYLASVQAEVGELEAKLEVARTLGDPATIERLERDIRSRTFRLVDAGKGEVGFEQTGWTLVPLKCTSDPRDFSLRCLVIPHYASFAEVGRNCTWLRSHLVALLSGVSSARLRELETPAEADVLAEWQPLLCALQETEQAISDRDFRAARRRVGELRSWVLDPAEGPLRPAGAGR